MVFYITEKSDLFLFLKKKHICYEEDPIRKIISCYMTQTKQTTKQQLFLHLKNLHALKKSDLHLKKNTNQF